MPCQEANKLISDKLDMCQDRLNTLMELLEKREEDLALLLSETTDVCMEDLSPSATYNLVLEKTTIRNSEEAFLFRVFEVSTQRLVFSSRKTILDRPCWRDDAIVDLLKVNSVYVMKIFKCRVNDYYSEECFDTVELPGISVLRDRLRDSSSVLVDVISKNTGQTYSFRVTYETAEYQQLQTDCQREKNLLKLQGEIADLKE